MAEGQRATDTGNLPWIGPDIDGAAHGRLISSASVYFGHCTMGCGGVVAPGLRHS